MPEYIEREALPKPSQKGSPRRVGGLCDNHQSAKFWVTTLAIHRARASGPG